MNKVEIDCLLELLIPVHVRFLLPLNLKVITTPVYTKIKYMVVLKSRHIHCVINMPEEVTRKMFT